MAKNSLYIYLARFDKKGMEVIVSIPNSEKVYPTRVKDIKTLCLPPSLEAMIAARARDNKMTHELYAESSESLDGLQRSLNKRGYSNLPAHQFSGIIHPAKVNRSALVTKSSTMLRSD